MEYSKIINPETGRQVSINSALGKQILRKYINNLQGGEEKCGRICQAKKALAAKKTAAAEALAKKQAAASEYAAKKKAAASEYAAKKKAATGEAIAKKKAAASEYAAKKKAAAGEAIANKKAAASEYAAKKKAAAGEALAKKAQQAKDLADNTSISKCGCKCNVKLPIHIQGIVKPLLLKLDCEKIYNALLESPVLAWNAKFLFGLNIINDDGTPNAVDCVEMVEVLLNVVSFYEDNGSYYIKIDMSDYLDESNPDGNVHSFEIPEEVLRAISFKNILRAFESITCEGSFMDGKELVEKDGEFKFQSIDDPDVQRLKDSYSKLARSYDKALDDILTIFGDGWDKPFHKYMEEQPEVFSYDKNGRPKWGNIPGHNPMKLLLDDSKADWAKENGLYYPAIAVFFDGESGQFRAPDDVESIYKLVKDKSDQEVYELIMKHYADESWFKDTIKGIHYIIDTVIHYGIRDFNDKSIRYSGSDALSYFMDKLIITDSGGGDPKTLRELLNYGSKKGLAGVYTEDSIGIFLVYMIVYIDSLLK